MNWNKTIEKKPPTKTEVIGVYGITYLVVYRDWDGWHAVTGLLPRYCSQPVAEPHSWSPIEPRVVVS